MQKNQHAVAQKVDSSSALCRGFSPNEQSLKNDLQGKKNEVEDAGTEVPSVKAPRSVQVLGIIDSNLESVKLVSESLPDNETGLINLEDHGVPPLRENLNSNYLKKIQSAVTQNGKLSCALCQIIAPNERALNEHFQGRKHKSREVALRADVTGQIHSIGLSPVTATKSVQGAGIIPLGIKNGIKFRAKSLLDANFKKQDRPSLPENRKSDDFMGDWNCALCQVDVPNERALNEHLHGKKHRLKEIADGAEGTVQFCSNVLSPMTAMDSIHVSRTIDLNIGGSVKFASESLLLKDSGAAIPEKRHLPQLQENMHVDDFTKNQSPSSKKVESSSALSQIIAFTEHGLHEHMQGKRHKFKKAALNEEPGEIPSLKAASEPVQAVGTTDESSGGRVKFTSEFFLVGDTRKSSLLEQNPPSPEKNLNSDDSKNICSELRAKVVWSSALCQVVAPNDQALNEHLHGKKHKLNEARAKFPIVTATESVQAVGTAELSMKEQVKFTSELLLHGKAVQRSIKGQDPPDLPENMNLGGLKKNQSAFTENVELSCATCQITAPNEKGLVEHLQRKKHMLKEAELGVEVGKKYCALCQLTVSNEQTLNEHLQGKKHRLKEVAVRTEGTGESCNIGLSPTSATDSVLVARRILEERAKFTDESSLLEKPEEASLKEQYLTPLQEKLHKSDSKINHSASAKRVEPTALCQIGASSKGQHGQLQGKKHEFKKAALIAEGTGENLSLMTATNSVQAVGTLNPKMAERMKCTVESVLHGRTGESSLRKQNLPPLQENVNSDDLKNQLTFVRKGEKSCALCRVVAPNEQALIEHLQGKKHRLKEAALRDAGPSSRGVNFTNESFQLTKPGEVNSGKLDSQLLLDGPNLGVLINNQSLLFQKVQVNGNPKTQEHVYGCEPCNVGASTKTNSNSHKKGKEHLKWQVKTEHKCGCSSPDPEQITECIAEYGINTGPEYVDETLDVQRSEDDWPIDSFKPEDCKFGVLSKTITNSHKKAKELLKWRVKRKGCDSSHPEQITECIGINPALEHVDETLDVHRSEDDWPISSYKTEGCKPVHSCTRITQVWVPKS